jgi:hypothetical protein
MPGFYVRGAAARLKLLRGACFGASWSRGGSAAFVMVFNGVVI